MSVKNRIRAAKIFSRPLRFSRLIQRLITAVTLKGDGIFQGGTDVIVCDGFAGNVALKTSEGLVTMVGARFRQAVGRGWLARLALLTVAWPAIKA